MINLEIFNLELFLMVGALLLIIGIFASRFFLKFGVPSLLLFLAVGMLAGSDGPGQIHFNDAQTAQFLGVIALVFILFYGGFTTDFHQIRPVLKESLSLATLGVALTAALTALAVWALTPLNFIESFLLGSIISSTDAPAVFSVLRAKNVNLSPRLQSILELESGSNDPMAVFLTLMATSLLGIGGTTPTVFSIGLSFFLQMGVGLGLGYLMARITLRLLKRFKLDYEGLYPVFALSLVFFTYSVIFFAQGSGFLGVYIMGLFMSKEAFLHKKSILKFGDGLSWLMQSMMFVILGLLVFPGRLIPLAGSGMLIALLLMFVIRPVSVFISLSFSSMNIREKILVSWVGLKGAVAIILATFPLMAGFKQADFLFHMVFFIVLSSTLIQGTTLPFLARWLKLDSTETPIPHMPIELADHAEVNTALVEVTLPAESFLCGTSMVETRFPQGSLVALVWRKGVFFIPNGSTVFETGDKLMILTDKSSKKSLEHWVLQKKEDLNSDESFCIEDYR